MYIIWAKLFIFWLKPCEFNYNEANFRLFKEEFVYFWLFLFIEGYEIRHKNKLKINSK
jgi:hypothetical protein